MKREHRPRLSISLLAMDGRDETLGKCLDSLGPIRAELPCELVAVYTGTSGEPLGFLEERCDRVVRFPWRDDFSEARNAGLHVCSGEWFMFIDDDEWFDDVSDLVAFFKDRRNVQYNSASYIVRNYTGPDGSTFQDTWARRICRMQKGLRFTGAVHESLEPFAPPEKYLGSHAHHYGYLFRTDEEKALHHERNIRLLEKELGGHPGDLRLLAHLANEYLGRDNGKLLDLCRGLSGGGGQEYGRDPYYGWIMAMMPEALAREGDPEEALRAASALLGDQSQNLNPYARAYIAAQGIHRCDTTGDWSHGQQFLGAYLEATEEIEQAPDRLARHLVFGVGQAVGMERKAAIAKAVICACSRAPSGAMRGLLEQALLEPRMAEAVFTAAEAHIREYPDQAGFLLKELAAVSVIHGSR